MGLHRVFRQEPTIPLPVRRILTSGALAAGLLMSIFGWWMAGSILLLLVYGAAIAVWRWR